MSAAIWKNSKKVRFKSNKFVEINDELVNPDRGWYQIHTFTIGDKINLKDREYTLNGTDSLAFVLIDIHKYRSQALDKKALDTIRSIFQFFVDYRMDMIVRFVYDTIGQCMEREPEDESQVIAHMNQLLPVLNEYAHRIFIYQGLLIGNWGEMHSSKFLSPQRLRRLAEVFTTGLDSSVFMAVRRPAYVRILFPEGEDVRQSKVGIYDDAILGSPTHLGTFGDQPAKEVRRERSWLPAEEIEYVSALCNRVPYGGEALWTDAKDSLYDTRRSAKLISNYFEKLHVDYLNRIHDVNLMDKLKEYPWTGFGIFRGMSAYDYIGRHLGYRFVMRDVRLKALESDASTLCWEITVENVGYSRAFLESAVTIVGEDEMGVPQEVDVSGWMELKNVPAGESHVFRLMTPRMRGKIYLRASKKSTGQSIYFANKGAGENLVDASILLGEIL